MEWVGGNVSIVALKIMKHPTHPMSFPTPSCWEMGVSMRLKNFRMRMRMRFDLIELNCFLPLVCLLFNS
jgi:hypothetical protein